MEHIHSDLPRHDCGGLESDESVFHLCSDTLFPV